CPVTGIVHFSSGVSVLMVFFGGLSTKLEGRLGAQFQGKKCYFLQASIGRNSKPARLSPGRVGAYSPNG
ncbi:MAG: hypothetical protein PHQ13_05710, partial [Rhodoferax sp.]|nr:hypothetical protein [Rhodoferax sp.]